jgi:hypothetical protein
MSYGQYFSRLLTSALEREESELSALHGPAGNSKQSVRSISQYYESWLSVPLLKEALRDPSCPELHWERKRVDMWFLEGDKELANFELKPFWRVPLPSDKSFQGIVADFGRQYEHCKKDSLTERYVVLTPYGDLDDVRGWIKDELLTRVQSEFHGIIVEEVPAPRPIKLNRSDVAYLVVEVFRVNVAHE